MQIVQRRQLGAEHLLREHQMAECATAEVRACVACTLLLHRPRIAGVTGIADHELAFAREEHPVPPVAGGQDTIEEVIPHACKG